MPIKETPLYICESCGYSGPDAFDFRIVEGRIAVGCQTLMRGSIYTPEVLCVNCFCDVMGIGHKREDIHSVDVRYEHVHYNYTGDDKGKDKGIDDD
jgi:hypothetical protein